ncbi:hypothetical protein GCM10010172_29000 [Paractinoplanes ferrugineus]|uniref:Uncharacterized protein n=1 Tax=Paractinoplanes ferrugineus TaxID=113564 RepID=A0A919MD69_9ACTN|nr:hypothetical protein Afe05nite_00300 [Actinoplanes ferrugineus]
MYCIVLGFGHRRRKFVRLAESSPAVQDLDLRGQTIGADSDFYATCRVGALRRRRGGVRNGPRDLPDVLDVALEL